MKSSARRRSLTRIAIIVICAELALAFTLIGIYKHFVPYPPGLSNEQGYHYGHDFIVYYATAQMTLDGDAAAVYELEKIHAVQNAIIQRKVPYAPWVYPPTFLLLILPFGFLPYIGAYTAWCVSSIAVGAAAGWTVLRRWWVPFLVIFFPATWLNLFAGQNGGITAGLMLGGLGLLHRHPIMAGALFGLMSYKPQFGLLIPLALATGRHWVSFASAAVTVVGFAAISFFAFGGEPWAMFLAQFQSDWIAQSEILWWKSVTIYPMARLIGLGPTTASAVQIASTLVAVGLVVHCWRRTTTPELQAASLAFGTLLATPRAMMYDLTLLLIPLFFVLARMVRHSSVADWTFVALLWLCPMVGFFIFENTNFQIWPVGLWAGMLFCIRRYSAPFPNTVSAPATAAR